MTIWIDAQLSPAQFEVSAEALRNVGLRDATDRQIFLAAKQQSAIVMTKDADFVKLLEDLDPPPQVIWITCGNTSNAHLKKLLETVWPRVSELLNSDEPLIEVSDLRDSGGDWK